MYSNKRDRVLIGFVVFVVVYSILSNVWASSYKWNLIGPPTARVLNFAVDPLNEDTIYVGTWDGFYKSTDGGLSWREPNPFFINNIPSIGVSKSNPNVVYVGSYTGGWGNGCLYKSTDGGNSWSSLRLNGVYFCGDIEEIAVSDNDSSVLIVRTLSNLYKSTDGGNSWTLIQSCSSNTPCPSQIVFDPNDQSNQTLYAIKGGRVHISTDGGFNWSDITPTNPIYYPDSIYKDLEVIPDSTGTLYIATTGNWGLLKVTNLGTKWSKIDITPPYNPNLVSVSVDKNNFNIIYVVSDTGSLYKSTDGGVTWTENPLNLTFREIRVSPSNSNILYGFIQSDNIYKSSDGGNTWQILNLSEVGISDIAVSYNNNTSTLLVCTSNSGLYLTNDNGSHWNNMVLYQGPVYAIVRSPMNPNIVYLANTSSVLKSIDSGIHWQEIGSLTYPDDIISLGIGYDDTLYVGTSYYGLFKLDSAGYGLIPTGMNNIKITSIAVDPTDSNIVYVSSEGALYKTTDGGATWTNLPISNANYIIGKIAINPQSPNIIYLSIYNSVQTTGTIYKSTDGGNTWTSLSLGLSGFLSVNDIAINPNNPQMLYAATSQGVLLSVNGGDLWVPVNNGLTDTWVYSIDLDPQNPYRVYAATGTGVYYVDFSSTNQPPQINAFTVQPSSGQAPFTVSFDCSATDPDPNQNILYQFDFDGDGIMDETNNQTGQTTYTYQTAGTYKVSCRAVDELGASSVAVAEVTVTDSATGGTTGNTKTTSSGGGGGCSMEGITETNYDLSLLIILFLWLYFEIKRIRRHS